MADITKDECFSGLAPQIKAFLGEAGGAKALSISRETYQEGRRTARAMGRKMKMVAPSAGTVEDRLIPGPQGTIGIRIYTPAGGRPLPVLVFYHGGAWVMGDLDMEEHICLSLAAETPCIVVSVDYRLAPEHPFPAGLNDCYAAFQWTAERAKSFGADPARVALCGESAGANLVAAVTLLSRDKGGPLAACQILFYPVTNLADFHTESHRRFGEGFLLSRAGMEGARSLYVANEADWSSPYVSPLLAQDLGGLPRALVITSGCDPLRDEGEAYARRLEDAGVPVRRMRYEDMVHGFLCFFPEADSARAAIREAAETLRHAFQAPERP